MSKSKNNIEKILERSQTVKEALAPEKPNNVIQFPIPPGSPLDEWWKDNKKLVMKMEEPEQRDFYYQLLNKYYKIKTLENKSIPELDDMLQELIELKQI